MSDSGLLGSRPLAEYGTAASGPGRTPPPSATWTISNRRLHFAVAVLCYVNLLNYMNWFLVAGVLLDIQKYFRISDKNAGSLQTVFICSLLVAAPLFGFLGDRYNRKRILSCGIVLWSCASLAGSFVSECCSWLFFLSRGVVGVGAASYSTVAPTIIGDLFVKDKRTWVLSIFYIFIPVGSGLGYILGSTVAQAKEDWRWAFRIMPSLEVVALVLLLLVVPDPPRGAAEKRRASGPSHSSWAQDVKYLGHNRSFIWSSLGVTAMGFVSGALGFWGPRFLYQARLFLGLEPPCLQTHCDSSDSLIFGGLAIGTGIVGVILGAQVARYFRKFSPKADSLLCAMSLLAAAPCLLLTIFFASKSIVVTYICLGLGELLLSFNWAVVTDILLAVVEASRRGTAEALQISVCHLLGDAGSPYLVGLISSAIQKHQSDSFLGAVRSLQYSFIICVFVTALGGGCFFLTALHVEADQRAARDGLDSGSEDEEGGENPAFLSPGEDREALLAAGP
ncbi:protein spinster homolog 3 [Ornithorhynchus anatinus]|uniref:protein spinster homolog 3 n=1 Tax=Ornithorhynchus anatinus TaxID=9258 RepID=UPI0010A91CA4|nr:protein spinster homolog 3 [Ornithorhynchus anatinus]